jgi:hypothetical protein
VGRGLGPWAGPTRPEIQTGRAGPKFKQYGPFRAWAGPGRAARIYTYIWDVILQTFAATKMPIKVWRASLRVYLVSDGTRMSSRYCAFAWLRPLFHHQQLLFSLGYLHHIFYIILYHILYFKLISSNSTIYSYLASILDTLSDSFNIGRIQPNFLL